MLERVRQVPLHRWLFWIALALAILAVPHMILTAAAHAPTPYVNAHYVATATLFILAQQRRQERERLNAAIRLAELTANAEYTRQR